MKIRHILLVVAVMTAAIVISIKIAMILLVLGGIVMLIGVGAAGASVMSIRGKCTDEHSPLDEAIWGTKSE